MTAPVRHIVVVGAMGVGKSTLAEGLAAALGRPHLDSDVAIEDDTGETGRDIVRREGVGSLHELEVAVLMQQLASEHASIVSAAAAVIDAPSARAALLESTVLWLDLPVADLLTRIELGPHRRPITARELVELGDRRRPHLERLADLRLDASSPPADLLVRALAFLGQD